MIKLNGEEFKEKKFPNGESLVDFANSNECRRERIDVEYYFDGDASLIQLMFIKKELDYINKNAKINLYIKYMPYARMDRRMEEFAFTLKHVCDFINELNFNKIIVDEAHSDMTLGLLNDSYQNLTSLKVLEKAMFDIKFDFEKDYIVLPDTGAEKRYLKPLQKCWIKNIMVGVKNRDLQSGNIISFDLLGTNDMRGGRAIIIDDLCSKGGTFLATAQKLKERNCSEIYLAIAHLEDNVHTGDLPKSDLIDGVYATKSIYTADKFNKKFDKLTLIEV